MNPVYRLSTILRHLNGNWDSHKICVNMTAEHFSFENRTYQYTLPNDILTDDQIKFYEDNGFLLLKNLFPHELLDKFTERFVDICKGNIPIGNMTLMKDISLAKTNAKGEFLFNKIQNIAYDDVFSQYMFYQPLLDYIECFTGPNIMAVHSMLINKPPDAGTLSSRHPLHQDLYYFPFRPAKRIVGTWTAMERVTVENGCLFVLPGTHKGVLHQHDYPNWDGAVNKMYHGVQGFDKHDRINIEAEKGDTILFHPLLIHGSGPNSTKGFRKAISFHFAASECEYIDVKGTLQENIAKEAENIIKKQGMELDYYTMWKMKSRLAKGIQISL